ncbi:hypothetical protein [Saccharothrix deserti]|uniref:hypothetical protein n=1 Tax=Saccharothrix deserti TaxID=2593674 RepID=UPI00131DA86F|nr:hypothetical protein [Saccharothrix deserti]
MTHPALQKAMDGCVRLAQAAGQVGSPDPIAAIRQIDYDPQAIEAYVQQLGTAAADLDKAIEEQEKAQAEHEASTEGSASDSASAAMSEELAELRDERKQLDTLINEVARIAQKMDELARVASDEILTIAGQADPAVSMVLDGSWLEDAVDGPVAEETVHLAVADIIKVCQATQDEVAALRSELNAQMDAAETGGQAEAGTSQGGPAQSGQSQGGESQQGQSEGGPSQGQSQGG